MRYDNFCTISEYIQKILLSAYNYISDRCATGRKGYP